MQKLKDVVVKQRIYKFVKNSYSKMANVPVTNLQFEAHTDAVLRVFFRIRTIHWEFDKTLDESDRELVTWDGICQSTNHEISPIRTSNKIG